MENTVVKHETSKTHRQKTIQVCGGGDGDGDCPLGTPSLAPPPAFPDVVEGGGDCPLGTPSLATLVPHYTT